MYSLRQPSNDYVINTNEKLKNGKEEHGEHSVVFHKAESFNSLFFWSDIKLRPALPA